MSVGYMPFLVQCWRDPMTGVMRLRVVDVDRAEEVRIADASFLVRVAIDQGRVMERCFIRHVASSREAYVQGGPGLIGFVQACLLDGTIAEPMQTEQTDT